MVGAHRSEQLDDSPVASESLRFAAFLPSSKISCLLSIKENEDKSEDIWFQRVLHPLRTILIVCRRLFKTLHSCYVASALVLDSGSSMEPLWYGLGDLKAGHSWDCLKSSLL